MLLPVEPNEPFPLNYGWHQDLDMDKLLEYSRHRLFPREEVRTIDDLLEYSRDRGLPRIPSMLGFNDGGSTGTRPNIYSGGQGNHFSL